MSTQKAWTKEQEELLKEKYPIMGRKWCAKKLSRSPGSISNKARRMGIIRDGNARYDRPDTPDGYNICFNCKQLLPEGSFYTCMKEGRYGKKQDLCRACNQERSRRDYRNNSEKILRRLHENPVRVLLQNCKTRAKKRGLEFNLEESDLTIPETCPALGINIIPFDRSDNSPSIDRLDPNKGYIKGNCEIISLRANRLKSNATLEELKKIIDWYSTKTNG